jgi:hypothetical protein
VLAVEGPVTAVDAASGTLLVLGQRVRADAGTAFEGFSGVSAVAAGDIVQVSGLRDASAGVVAATRIELRPPYVSGVTMFEVEGEVSAPTATTFQLGALAVNYANATLVDIPAGALPPGFLVKVTATAPPVAGTLTASVVRSRAAPVPAAGTRLEIDGYIADYVSVAMFRAGGLPVNAATARFENGTAADLANGRRVEVEGTVSAGVLAATKVEFQTATAESAAELEGAITDFLSLANFRVRGQAVDATRATVMGGTAAELANGRVVHVKGRISGGVLVATQVEFQDTMPAEDTRLTVEGAITDFASPQAFRVNGQAVGTMPSTQYSGGVAADLANGRRVRVDGSLRSGVLVAMLVTIKPVAAAPVVTTEGLVTNFISFASFTVNGQRVATNAQTLFTNGSAASLANGVRVAVKGSIASGVLVATSVDIRRENVREVEVEGYITSFISVASFKVAGQLVDASTASFEGGTAAKLANGLKVHATGPVSAGVLKARKLEIGNDD